MVAPSITTLVGSASGIDLIFNGVVTAINGVFITAEGIVCDLVSHGNPGNIDPGHSGYSDYFNAPGLGPGGTPPFGMSISAGGAPGYGVPGFPHTFYYRAFAQNDTGAWGYGNELTLTENVAIPIVITQAITGTSTLNGMLDNDKAETCQCGFVWGTNITYGNTTPTTPQITGDSFSYTLTGLAPGTYHFAAKATNSAGTDIGSDQSFIVINAPTVAILSTTLITTTSALMNAKLINDGGEICSCWFEYSTDLSYSTTTAPENHTINETFSISSGVLTVNTHYYCRAAVSNSVGTAYDYSEFTTLVDMLTVQSDAISDVTQTSLTMNGTLTYAGGEDCTCGFILFGNQYVVPGLVTESSSFSFSISNLDCDINDTYKAFAQNSAGIVYGADIPFTTDPQTLPVVETIFVDQVTETSAVFHGLLVNDGGKKHWGYGDYCEVGFKYGEQENNTYIHYGSYSAYNYSTSAVGTGLATFESGTPFSFKVVNLSANGVWHFTAWAWNLTGMVYGTDIVFRTAKHNSNVARGAPGSGSGGAPNNPDDNSIFIPTKPASKYIDLKILLKDQ